MWILRRTKNCRFECVRKESNYEKFKFGTGAKNDGAIRRLAGFERYGDYVPKRYLYADEILTHIKAKRTVKGYVFYKGKIPGKNVVSDGTNFAHCSTFREGVIDLKFKAAKDRGAEQYKNLTLDSELTAEEIITMYRVITGACRQGTESFVSSLGELKEKYTIREAIEITKGQYNAKSFERFFKGEG